MSAGAEDWLYDYGGRLLNVLSIRFVLAAAVFVLIALVLRRFSPRVRLWGQVCASLVLIGVLTTPWIAAIMVAYAGVFFWVVESAALGRARVPIVILLLGAQVVGPIFWLPHLPGYAGKVREFVTFATNMTLLRSWAYAYDRLSGRDPVPGTLGEYVLFTFYFPAFLNGPFVSLSEFRARRVSAYWEAGTATPGIDARGLLRVAVGVSAIFAALYLLPALQVPAYQAALAGGARWIWAHAAVVYVAFYLSFTAWTEVAIGMGRLGGVVLPENFNAPHLSYGVADFWRRWNITLGHWLRSYIYLPLGGALPRRRSGARKLEWRNTVAVFAVMAAYHVLGALKLLGPVLFPMRAWVPWMLWAALNAVGVLATRRLGRAAGHPLQRTAIVAATLAFASLTLMTAFYPPSLGLSQLVLTYRRMFLLG